MNLEKENREEGVGEFIGAGVEGERVFRAIGGWGWDFWRKFCWEGFGS